MNERLDRFIDVFNAKERDGKKRYFSYNIQSSFGISHHIEITIQYVIGFVSGTTEIEGSEIIGSCSGPVSQFGDLSQLVIYQAEQWISSKKYLEWDKKKERWKLEDKNRITEKIKEKLSYITSNESDLKVYSESIYNILMDEK